MPVPTIDALPDAPVRSETPSTFTAKAEAWVAALTGWTSQVNALATYLAGLTGSAGDITATALTMATGKLLGRTTASDGAIEEIAVGSGLAFASGELKLSSYILPFFFTTAPLASEVLALHVAGAAFTIPANFAGALQSSVGANPAGSFALDVQKNGSSIGTITVSTSGTVTATTADDTPQSIAAGDLLKIVAPGSADATAANMAFTIIGVR